MGKRNQLGRTLRPASSDGGVPRNSTPRLGGQLWAWYSDRSPVVHFGLKFGLLMALYYGVILIPFFDRLLFGYLGESAQVGASILNLLGNHVQVAETSIRSAEFSITVRRGCDGIEPFWFFCAGVLAAPASWSRKIPGIMVGAVLILSLNLVRIVSLFLIGLHSPGLFSTAHLEIWPAIFIILGIALWVGWISWAKQPRRLTGHVAA